MKYKTYVRRQRTCSAPTTKHVRHRPRNLVRPSTRTADHFVTEAGMANRYTAPLLMEASSRRLELLAPRQIPTHFQMHPLQMVAAFSSPAEADAFQPFAPPWCAATIAYVVVQLWVVVLKIAEQVAPSLLAGMSRIHPPHQPGPP